VLVTDRTVLVGGGTTHALRIRSNSTPTQITTSVVPTDGKAGGLGQPAATSAADYFW
jgi:hypothetical protein